MDLTVLSHDPREIRVNENLMRSYIELYKSVFNKEPNCLSCSFKNDFNRLRDYLKNKENKEVMSLENKEYKLNVRYRDDILRYSKNGKTYRIYGRNLTDEFAKNYLKQGSKKQLKERAEKFDSIPKKETPKKKKNKK